MSAFLIRYKSKEGRRNVLVEATNIKKAVSKVTKELKIKTSNIWKVFDMDAEIL